MVAFNVKTRALKRMKNSNIGEVYENSANSELTIKDDSLTNTIRQTTKNDLCKDYLRYDKTSDKNSHTKIQSRDYKSKTKWKAPNILQSMNFINIPILTKLSFISLLLSITG